MSQHPETWAIVPIKGAGEPKRRLNTILTLQQRIKLQGVMAEHVLAELRVCELLDCVLLVSEDPAQQHLIQTGSERFYHYRDDTFGDINRALYQATLFAQEHGAQTVVVILADLPALRAEEVDQLIKEHRSRTFKPHITLVSNRDGHGTNCLASTPPLNLPYQFGRNSFHQFRNLAKRMNIECVSLELPSIKFDIDEPGDLERYLQTAAPESKIRMLLTDQNNRCNHATPIP